MNKQGMTYSE